MTSSTTEDAQVPVRLVVGLGNPGRRYERTRHNAGQRVVEELARRLGVTRWSDRFAGRFADTRGPAGPVALLVPTTFMNDSGRAVGPAAGSLHSAPEGVLVVHDDVDLPFGTVRGKRGGGHGGHNGLRSVDAALGSRDYLRVRVGVGRPDEEFRGDTAAWVLAGFSEPDDAVASAIDSGADMVESVLRDGIEAAIASHHASPPGSRAKARAVRRAAVEGPEEQG